MRKLFTVGLLLTGLATGQHAAAQQFWIVGGQSAHEGQFPWVGDMRIFNTHLCGSALIDPRWVVTAGHCTYDPFSMGPMDTAGLRVRFNTVNTNAAINPAGGVEGSVERIFTHPEFLMDEEEFFSNGHDIALLKLREPVMSIEPIDLPALSDSAVVYATGYPVKIAGWGISDPETFDSPDTMKFCNTKVYDFNLCSALVGGVSTSSFCAGYTSSEAEAGAAAGDSGGPVWVELNGNKKIIGVVSGGILAFTAADTPGVYTKVAAFRPWIDSVINANGGFTTGIDKKNWQEQDIRIGYEGQALRIFFGAIDAPAVACDIYSADGRKVYHTGIRLPASRSYSLDMGTLAPGLYIIRFHSAKDGKQLSRKFVKNY